MKNVRRSYCLVRIRYVSDVYAKNLNWRLLNLLLGNAFDRKNIK